jgi:ATP-dependent Clp protease ATP-binding subunit ClpC
MFERFTDRARRVVVLAQEEARMLNHNYIGTEHILLGLVREGDGVAARALESLNISLEAVRQQIEELIGQGQAAPTGHIPFTSRARRVLGLARGEAMRLGHNYIGTEHILLGLIREGEGVAAQVLQKLGADLNRVRQTVIQLLSGYTAGREGSKVGGEAEMAELTSEMPATEPASRAPTCPNCFAALDDTLAIRTVEAEIESPTPVKIAYCRRCGVALGTVS